MADFIEKEIWCENEGYRIYGKAILPGPEEEGPYPLIIFAHELGDNHVNGLYYAKELVPLGYAMYTFDFPCSTVARLENKSDGELFNYSTLADCRHLLAVTKTASGWSFVDPDNIILFGCSLGGVASFYTAYTLEGGKIPKAVISCYPALVIYDNIHKQYSSKDQVPESYELFEGGFGRVSGRATLEMWDYNIYDYLPNIKQKVLLLHGDADTRVPISFSERARDIIPNCEYHVIPGGKHGFRRETFDTAVAYIKDFISRL